MIYIYHTGTRFIYIYLFTIYVYPWIYYGFSLLHKFSLVLQPWMSAYITLVWPHDGESFQGSTFCLFVMVQPWNIGRSLLNRSGICDGINCCNMFLFIQPFTSIHGYITDLVYYTNFHWFFSPECQHIFGKQTGYIFQSPKMIKTWTTKH
jgi:hypothetical protein